MNIVYKYMNNLEQWELQDKFNHCLTAAIETLGEVVQGLETEIGILKSKLENKND